MSWMGQQGNSLGGGSILGFNFSRRFQQVYWHSDFSGAFSKHCGSQLQSPRWAHHTTSMVSIFWTWDLWVKVSLGRTILWQLRHCPGTICRTWLCPATCLSSVQMDSHPSSQISLLCCVTHNLLDSLPSTPPVSVHGIEGATMSIWMGALSTHPWRDLPGIYCPEEFPYKMINIPVI